LFVKNVNSSITTSVTLSSCRNY